MAALPAYGGTGGVLRLASNGELYEDLGGGPGWRRVRGDMLKSVYDTNNNGNADNADNAFALGTAPASLYARTDQDNSFAGLGLFTKNLDPGAGYVFPSGLYMTFGTNRSAGEGEGNIIIGPAGGAAMHMRVYRAKTDGTLLEKLRLTDADLLIGSGLNAVWHAGNLKPGVSVPVRTVTSSYAVLSTDAVLFVDASAGAVTVTLPTVASAITAGQGQRVKVKKIDTSTNAVTVVVSGGGLIDGAAQAIISTPYNAFDFIPVPGTANWGGF